VQDRGIVDARAMANLHAGGVLVPCQMLTLSACLSWPWALQARLKSERTSVLWPVSLMSGLQEPSGSGFDGCLL